MEISLVYYQFQNIFIFLTRPNAQTLHFGDERMRTYSPEVSRTRPNCCNSEHTTHTTMAHLY